MLGPCILSREKIHAIWCVPKENYNNFDVIRQNVIRYSHADWLKRFSEFVLRLATNLSTLPSSGVRCRPHCRLAISKVQQENFQNIARLWLIRFARPSTPTVHRSQGPYTMSPGFTSWRGMVWTGHDWVVIDPVWVCEIEPDLWIIDPVGLIKSDTDPNQYWSHLRLTQIWDWSCLRLRLRLIQS